jgi:ribosomal protein L37AE/L43A
MAILLPDGEIDQYLQRHVCSRCYGDLQKTPADNRLWEAKCPTCGEAWHGTTVRRSTAERRGQMALSESHEVKENLPDLFPNPHKGKSIEELIKELGF